MKKNLELVIRSNGNNKSNSKSLVTGENSADQNQ